MQYDRWKQAWQDSYAKANADLIRRRRRRAQYRDLVNCALAGTVLAGLLYGAYLLGAWMRG